MTKLKFSIEKDFSDIKELTLIIANHNGRINPVSLDDISSWLWALRSIWPTNRTKDIHAVKYEAEPNKLYIMEEKKCVATIEEIELHELQPENDIDEMFMQPGSN
tara:strand:- start:400 stop:714 length:315 start_codon:yes stop_codon:yes gene_type:complete